MSEDRRKVAAIAADLGCGPVADDWTGIDAVWPLIEQIKKDGAVFLIKLDGERKEPDDTGAYTVAAIGARMEGEPIRIDTETLEEGIAFVIVQYAKRFWDRN